MSTYRDEAVRVLIDTRIQEHLNRYGRGLVPGGSAQQNTNIVGFGNPTGTIGLTAVNGTATTAMRSDATPPLNQAIVPTWTGAHVFNGGLTANTQITSQGTTAALGFADRITGTQAWLWYADAGSARLWNNLNGDLLTVNRSTSVFGYSGRVDLNAGGRLANNQQISTPTFASGFLGSGFRIDQGIAYASQTTAEFDNLVVRGLMRVYELVINKIRVSRGSALVSPGGGKVASVASLGGSSYRLTWEDNPGLVVNDLMRAQKFTGTGTYQSLVTVTAVNVGGNDLVTDVTLSSGTASAAGFEYAQSGHPTDTNRQGLIYLTADDSGAPFMEVVDGLTSHASWGSASVRRTRLGKLGGITDPFFGALSGYGIYASRGYFNGVRINGSLVIGPGVGFSTAASLYCAFDAAPGTSTPNYNGHLGQAAITAGSPAAGGGAFGGSTGSVTVNASNRIAYSASNNFSISAGSLSMWVYVTSTASIRTFFAGDTDGSIVVYAGSTNIVIDRKNVQAVINATATWTANVWQHVCVTWAGRNIAAYVDGAQVGTGTASADFVVPTNLLVGNFNASGSLYPLNGNVDDLAIIPRTLTSDEANAIANADAPLSITRSNFELVLTDASAGRVTANALGIFGTSASGKPNFTLLNSSQSVNGETLGEGDTLLGDNSSSKSNLLWDNSAGLLALRAGTTNILSIGAATGVVEGVLTLGTSGGIWQGSAGSFASPTTGFRIRHDAATGRGVWETYSGGVAINYINPGNMGFYTVGGRIRFINEGMYMDASTGFQSNRAINFVAETNHAVPYGELYTYTSDPNVVVSLRARVTDNYFAPWFYGFGGVEHTSGGTARAALYASGRITNNGDGTYTVYNLASIVATSNYPAGTRNITYTADSHTFVGTKSGFVIDHPLHPMTMELAHGPVESPEFLTFYAGTVTLDERGEAAVTMPEWFSPLNKDVRYMLTCVDEFAPVYVRRVATDGPLARFAEHMFIIAGGKPGQRVDWHVTGVRDDPQARRRPFQVERQKPDWAYGGLYDGRARNRSGLTKLHAPPGYVQGATATA